MLNFVKLCLNFAAMHKFCAYYEYSYVNISMNNHMNIHNEYSQEHLDEQFYDYSNEHLHDLTHKNFI